MNVYMQRIARFCIIAVSAKVKNGILQYFRTLLVNHLNIHAAWVNFGISDIGNNSEKFDINPTNINNIIVGENLAFCVNWTYGYYEIIPHSGMNLRLKGGSPNMQSEEGLN